MTDFHDSEYALLLRALLSRLANRTVFDVGAESGGFVEFCIAAGSPRVFAFEPYPAHVSELRRKFAHQSAVTIVDAAVGQADEAAPLHVARNASGDPLDGGHTLVRRPDASDVRYPSALGVQCRSLDSLAADGSIPRSAGLLRLGITGAGVLVLHGARSIASAIVAFDTGANPQANTRNDPPELVALLASRGYRDVVAVKRRDGLEWLQIGSTERRDGEFRALVFIHESVRADLLPTVYAAGAAAADRLAQRAAKLQLESRTRLELIESLQNALTAVGAPRHGGVHAAEAESAQPWVQPPPPGEPERLRSRRPRVSVITPSFNQARFLDQTMRSVFDQGYPNLEYIVIDGGSTDGSVDIIRRYADRLAYWVSEPDRGQASAVNKGMARVTGDIVGWVNSDDFYYPGAIQAAVDAFAADPGLAFVYGRGNRVDDDGALIEPFQFSRPFDLQALTNGIDYILQPTAFMRRGALAQVSPLDPTLHWTLDWDLWIRLGRRFPARMIDHVTAASREHASTKTSSGGLDRLEEIRRTIRHHTGHDVSVGYINYLLYAVLDAMPASQVPMQESFEDTIHHVLSVCRDVLLERPPRRPGMIRRVIRAVVPPRQRRAVGHLIARIYNRLRDANR
jgi:FkbM family methyltransferase